MAGVVYLSIVTVVCGTVGTVLLLRRISLFINGERVEGSFVRWETRGLRRVHYYPVVRFEGPDGSNYEFVGSPGSSSKKEERTYQILYPVGNPKGAMVHGILAYWGAPLAFWILAACSGLAALKQL